MNVWRPLFASPTLAACLLLASCVPRAPGQQWVEADDPVLKAMAARLLPEVARRAGMEVRRPVRVALRGREALESYLRGKLDEELPPPEAERVVAAYSLLGLVEPGLDLRSLLLSVYLEQVVGFYEPDSVALFVVEGQPDDAVEPVLVHELTHALQDQYRSLDSLTTRERGNDARTAAQAALEGHATLVMMEWALSRTAGREVDLADFPGLDASLDAAMTVAGSGFPRLSEAPRVVREGLLYPYVEGARFAAAVWRTTSDRASALGPHLPQSTEQVSDPARLLGSPPDAPVRLVFDGGSPPVFQDNLGRLELGILLEERGGGEGTADLAAGWAGDQYALYGAAGSWSLRWVVLWDDETGRNAFLRWAKAGGAPPGAEAGPLDVEGWPGAEVVVGRPPPGRVRIRATQGGRG